MNRCTRVRALRSCSGFVHVARVVVSLVVHAVVCLTLGLIAHVVVVVFVVAVSVAIFLYLEVYSLHHPSVTVNCCWLLPNITVTLHQINFENHFHRIIGPITVSQVSPIDQCWVQRRGDTQMKDATRNLASSTKTRKSFATNFGNKLDPLDS